MGRVTRQVFILLVLAAWFLFSGRTLAEGLSSYSVLGIGDLRYASGTRSAGMGYTGLGIPSHDVINPLAPASWTELTRQGLEAGLLYQGFTSTDGTNTLFLSRAAFNGALFAIPMSRTHGLVLVGGIVPYTGINHNTFSGGSYTGTSDTLTYRLQEKGKGGIGKFIIGGSYRPTSFLAFGASFDFLFGSLESSLQQTVSPDTYAGATFTQTLRARGGMFTGGFRFSGFDLLSESLKPLSFGAVVSTGATLSASFENQYQFSESRDTLPDLSGDVKIPLSWGIGVGYQVSERLLLAADYYSQAWSKSLRNGAPLPDVRNMFRTGAGIERTGSLDPMTSFLDRSSFRFGLCYHSTYYNPDNHPVNEWLITGGATIPLSAENRIAFALEFGKRGTTENDLIEDTIVRVAVSVHITELWFIRPEED